MPSSPHALLAPALTASAVVLAGLLASQLGRRAATQDASASVVNASPGFTLLSASVRNDEEGLLVIDNASETLLLYTMSNRDRAMLLAGGIPLTRLFEEAADGGIELEGEQREATGRNRERAGRVPRDADR